MLLRLPGGLLLLLLGLLTRITSWSCGLLLRWPLRAEKVLRTITAVCGVRPGMGQAFASARLLRGPPTGIRSWTCSLLRAGLGWPAFAGYTQEEVLPPVWRFGPGSSSVEGLLHSLRRTSAGEGGV